MEELENIMLNGEHLGSIYYWDKKVYRMRYKNVNYLVKYDYRYKEWSFK